MKLTKYVILGILGLSIFMTACNGSDDDSDDMEMTDDIGGTDDMSGEEEMPNDDGSTGFEGLLDVSGVTGFDQEPADLADWDLIFEEQFDSNLSAWNVWTGGAFNNELQLYQGANLTVSENYLFIQGKREDTTGPTNPFDSTSKDFEFTSGRIQSNQAYSPGNQTDGTKLRFSARILVPAGDGLWPAFWSFNDPWPTNGEIDILEFRGNNTGEYIANFFYGTTPGTTLTNPGATTEVIQAGTDLTMEWHVFGMIWEEEIITILLDGEVVHTFTEAEWGFIDDMYNKSQRLVLNMAIGGDFFNGQNLDPENIPDESFTVVDWVRVYKQ